jgi:L-ascorbate metabolism protein UlaG (beta-lactamase superfamily)
MRKLERAVKVGKKYLNPVETSVGDWTMAFKLLPLYLTNKAETEPRIPIGPFPTDQSIYEADPASGLRVTWFGHSSNLLEIDGVRVLVDPVWDLRAAPYEWFGPKRFFAPTIPLENLPPVDAVLISHDHYDHLGAGTVRQLVRISPNLHWVTPLGVGAVLQGFGVRADRITELDWTESTIVQGREGAEATVTSVPARHFSGRSLLNRFETLWSAFVIAGSKNRVYYGADTGLWDGFEAVAAAYGPFDLTMLEVGAFNERWKDIHMGPDGAVQAFAELGGGILMPIHWGLFNLALHAWREPIERIYELAAQQNIRLFSPPPGHPTEVAELRSEWWR